MFRKENKKEIHQSETTVNTSNHLTYDLILAIKDDDLATVKKLCEANVDINAHLSQEITGIKFINNVKSTISHPITIYDTPLSVAIQYGRNDIVAYLLEKDANTNESCMFSCHFKRHCAYPTDTMKELNRVRYTDNLIGLACFSPINHEVFKMLLRRTDNICPPVYNKRHTTKYNLIRYLHEDLSLQKDDINTRLALLICEAILRNDQALLKKMKHNYFSNVTTDFLRDYLSDIALDEEQIKQAETAIQYLETDRIISIKLGESLKSVIHEKANNRCETQFMCTEKTDLPEGNGEKEASRQNDNIESVIAELKEQNQELKQLVLVMLEKQDTMAKQIETLQHDQARLLRAMDNRNQENEIKKDNTSKGPSFFT